MSYSKADIEAVLNLINEHDVSALKKEDYEIFQYQGFDPMEIVRSLIAARDSNKVQPDNFKADIVRMIAIGMIKGSITDKNYEKMTEEGKKGVDDLQKIYGIKKGGGRGVKSSVITFPRVMATFPDLAIRMVPILGPKEFRGGPLLSTRLPDVMQVQVFPSIIPRELEKKTKNFLMIASLCYSIDQSVQISQIKNPDLLQLSSDQGNYVMIGHQSIVPSEAVRKSTFRSLNLQSEYDNILQVVTTYQEKVDKTVTLISKEEFTAGITSA